MSQKVRIGYQNLWRDGLIIASSSNHPQFPVENTQDDDKSLHWRSRYGSGSGGGCFVVTATNKYIDFDEGGSELTGTVVEGGYTGTGLATAIATALNAAPGKALTYTCTYSESTAKFTIGAGANFTIRWQNGTHEATDISGLCGYSDAGDDTGAASYVSDYMRINTYEYIDVDLTTAHDYNAIAILNHNLQSTATMTLYGADDAAFTTNVVADSIAYYGNNIFYLQINDGGPVTRTKRYLRLMIYDLDNPSGYVKVGNIVVFKFIEFTPYIKAGGYNKGEDNPSLVDFSDSQNLYADDKPRLFKRSYPFEGLTNTDASNIILMQEECGDHKGIVVCTDPDNPNTSSEWVTLAELNEVEYQHVNYWNWTMNVREHK